jgi:hypothetical protein
LILHDVSFTLGYKQGAAAAGLGAALLLKIEKQ